MLLEEFVDEIFRVYVSGNKDKAKEMIKNVIRENVEDVTSKDIDLNKVLKYSVGEVSNKLTDEIEKSAKDVYEKIKKTKDWNEVATIYLTAKGMSADKITKVIAILDSLYNE